MSSTIERQAADFTPGTPHARATVTTAELIVLPTGWAGKFVEFTAATGSGSAVDVAIRFGTETALPVIADRSALDGSGNLTADVSVPHVYVLAGTSKRVRIPRTATHLCHISGATTGCLRFVLATGEG